MMKQMSKRARIQPHLTKDCLRATSVTVLSDQNCETRHIKSVAGHKSDQAVESYNERPSIEQQQRMSLVRSEFIGSSTTSVSMKKENDNKQSVPHHIQLEKQQMSQQASEKRVLVENSFSKTCVAWRSKFSTVVLQLPCFCSADR